MQGLICAVLVSKACITVLLVSVDGSWQMASMSATAWLHSVNLVIACCPAINGVATHTHSRVCYDTSCSFGVTSLLLFCPLFVASCSFEACHSMDRYDSVCQLHVASLNVMTAAFQHSSCLLSLQCCSPDCGCCIVCGHVSALALVMVHNVQQVYMDQKLYMHPGAFLIGLSSAALVPCSMCEPVCAAAVTTT